MYMCIFRCRIIHLISDENIIYLKDIIYYKKIKRKCFNSNDDMKAFSLWFAILQCEMPVDLYLAFFLLFNFCLYLISFEFNLNFQLRVWAPARNQWSGQVYGEPHPGKSSAYIAVRLVVIRKMAQKEAVVRRRQWQRQQRWWRLANRVLWRRWRRWSSCEWQWQRISKHRHPKRCWITATMRSSRNMWRRRHALRRVSAARTSSDRKIARKWTCKRFTLLWRTSREYRRFILISTHLDIKFIGIIPRSRIIFA